MTKLLSSPEPRLKLSQFAKASSVSNSSVKNSELTDASSVGAGGSVAAASVGGTSVGSGWVAVGRTCAGSCVGGWACVGGVSVPPLNAEQANPTSRSIAVKKKMGFKGFIFSPLE